MKEVTTWQSSCLGFFFINILASFKGRGSPDHQLLQKKSYIFASLYVLFKLSAIGATIRIHWEIQWSPAYLIFRFIFKRFNGCILKIKNSYFPLGKNKLIFFFSFFLSRWIMNNSGWPRKPQPFCLQAQSPLVNCLSSSQAGIRINGAALSYCIGYNKYFLTLGAYINLVFVNKIELFVVDKVINGPFRSNDN